MGRKKKEEPKVVNKLEINIMDNGEFRYTTDNIHGWALQTFVELFLKSLIAQREG